MYVKSSHSAFVSVLLLPPALSLPHVHIFSSELYIYGARGSVVG
jgi:hypothetical protein